MGLQRTGHDSVAKHEHAGTSWAFLSICYFTCGLIASAQPELPPLGPSAPLSSHAEFSFPGARLLSSSGHQLPGA